MKNVIYTSLFGAEEELHPISYKSKHWDYVCFTNSDDLKTDKGWRLIDIRQADCEESRIEKFPKLMPHLFLKEYQYSIYIDSNIDIVDPSLYLNAERAIQEKQQFAALLNTKHSSYLDEAKECIKQGKDSVEVLKNQLAFYKQKGFDENINLLCSSILFREHHTITDLSQLWWEQVQTFSLCEDLALAYCLWKLNLPSNILMHEKFDVHHSDSFKYRKFPMPFTVKPLRKFFQDIERFWFKLRRTE